MADVDGVMTGPLLGTEAEENTEPALAELTPKGPQTEADVIMDILGPPDYDEATPTPKEPLKVCLLNADTYGIKGMGGTATAYWLLAETLAKYTENGQKPFRVRVLAPSAPSLRECQALEKLYTSNGMELICIDPKGHSQKFKWTFYMPYLTQGAATLEWFRQSSTRECDVMHVHEWGGLAVPILQARLIMDPKLSARLPQFIVVESHGGHMWSGLSHSPRRPADLVALEVDYHEKFTLEQSDTTLSPSRYMLRYFHERGWKPANAGSIPNILDMAGLPPSAMVITNTTYKPPTRIVFFSRLEDRKGLHVFAQAIDIVANATSAPLIIDFMGKEGLVNRMKALTYLRTHHLKRWPKTWTIRTMTDLPRNDALEKLTADKDKTLVILPSLVENMPYVVAECAMLGMQTVMFDVGGIREMLTSGTVVRNRDARELGMTIWNIVNGNQRAERPVLADSVTKSDKIWIEWHRRVWISGRLPQVGRHEWKPRRKPAEFHSHERSMDCVIDGIIDCPRISWIDPKAYRDAYDMYQRVCTPETEGAHGFLIKPSKFRFLGGDIKLLMTLAKPLFNDPRMVAITGGLRAGTRESDAIALPHGPFYYARMTWKRCIAEYPVLVKRGAFCQDFSSEARSFRDYQAWLLMTMLEQSGYKVATLPQPVFEIIGGHGDHDGVYERCNEESDPVLRLAQLGEPIVMDLKNEAAVGRIREYVVTTPAKGQEKVIADSLNDFSGLQGQNGWGYLFRPMPLGGPKDPKVPMRELVFNAKQNTWMCPPSKAGEDSAWFGFPYVKSHGFHPCAAAKGDKCCDGKDANSVIVRWTSYMHVEIAAIRVSFHLMGRCGDGVDVEVRTTSARMPPEKATKVLEVMKFDRDVDGEVTITNPMEATYELGRILPGDTVEVELSPHSSMDCDFMTLRVQVSSRGLGWAALS